MKHPLTIEAARNLICDMLMYACTHEESYFSLGPVDPLIDGTIRFETEQGQRFCITVTDEVRRPCAVGAFHSDGEPRNSGNP